VFSPVLFCVVCGEYVCRLSLLCNPCLLTKIDNNNNNNNQRVIVDVTIPTDIVATEQKKIIKYQQLRLELEKLWNIKLIIIPIVIETLGSFTSNLH